MLSSPLADRGGRHPASRLQSYRRASSRRPMGPDRRPHHPNEGIPVQQHNLSWEERYVDHFDGAARYV